MGWWELIGQYLTGLTQTVRRVWSLDPAALDRAGRFGLAVPVGVAIVAGISIMVGQSLVLAINRVGRSRAVLTMIASGLGTLLIGAIEALLVAGLGRLILGNSPRVAELLPSVLIAFAPYWWGFLVLLPYSGQGVARLLQVWHLLALWTVLIPVLDATSGPALLVAAAAWLATIGVDWVIEHSPLRLRERAFRLVSGSKGLTSRDLMAAAAAEVPR